MLPVHIIEPLREETIPHLLDLLEDIVGQVNALGTYTSKFDRSYTEAMARGTLSNADWFVQLAFTPNARRCVGIVVASCTSLLFSQDKTINVEDIYVLADTTHRGQCAAMLLDKVEWWARQHDAISIRGAETGGTAKAGADAMFKSNGYSFAGTIYKKDVV